MEPENETDLQPTFPDNREKTYQERLKIGFLKDYHDWSTALPEKTDAKLSINNHPVMEDWEREYMQTLARFATLNGGRILEVGYGLGISSRAVQQHAICEHVIIEANRTIFADVCTFAQEAVHTVVPLLGFWQDITPMLPNASFDGILFDTYPLSEEEVHRNHFPFFVEAFRLLKKGGIFTYYSDEITDFGAEHRALLEHAGFTHIDGMVCKVNPGKECLYWKSATILAPYIRK